VCQSVRYNEDTVWICSKILFKFFRKFQTHDRLRISLNKGISLDHNAFRKFQNITHLDLTGSLIISLQRGCFDGLDRLRILCLKNCDIVTIEQGVFNTLNNLTSLDLSHNGISIIRNGWFNHLHNLTYLGLERLYLIQAEQGCLDGLVKLEHLCMANTPIGAFKEELKNLNGLKCFSSNMFNYATILSSVMPTNLEHLDMSNSVITILRAKYFEGMNNLISINMVNCKMKLIDFDAFKGLNPTVLIFFDSHVFPCQANNGINYSTTLRNINY
jgi:Leucine-rich repeat (LRR) protein